MITVELTCWSLAAVSDVLLPKTMVLLVVSVGELAKAGVAVTRYAMPPVENAASPAVVRKKLRRLNSIPAPGKSLCS